MKPILSSASALMLIFATHDAFGQERKFADYNCAMTPPAGWEMRTNLPPQFGLVAAFGKPDKTRLVLLLVDDRNHPSGPLDSRFVSEFEIGAERSGGGKRLSGKFIEISGIKSYERLGYATVGQKTASILMQLVPADGRFYSLQGMRFDGDANRDPEIRECLATFRFITPPAAQTLSHSSGSAAYQTGYLMGKISVLVLLIAAGVVIVRTIAGRKRRDNRGRPPPLPDSR